MVIVVALRIALGLGLFLDEWRELGDHVGSLELLEQLLLPHHAVRDDGESYASLHQPCLKRTIRLTTARSLTVR